MADILPVTRDTLPPVGRAPIHLDELRALAEAGQAIVQAKMDEDQLCELIFQQAARLMDASSFHLGLFDKDDLVIKVWLRHGKRLAGARFVGGANEGVLRPGDVIQQMAFQDVDTMIVARSIAGEAAVGEHAIVVRISREGQTTYRRLAARS